MPGAGAGQPPPQHAPGSRPARFVVTGSFTGYHPVELDQPVIGEFEGFGTMEATIVGVRCYHACSFADACADTHGRRCGAPRMTPCARAHSTFSFG